LSLSNIIIISSVLSLIIGSLLGLTQYRIKRLFAYSTISHLGFILLTLAINDLESTRAFFFYIIQYSISNLNAFIILITIGYTLYSYVLKNNETNIKDSNYSPIQLISQLRGYFYINPFLSISLCMTLFSFVGVPPLIGFFGKQMVLMSALNKGFIFITFIAIITSVISAIYYLIIIKIMFFEKKNYIYHEKSLSIINKLKIKKDINITNYITISSYLSFIISTLSLLIVLYMFFNKELIRLIYLLI
jgi:NADH-ubiquinone oxidoreductase chain 2